MRVPRGYRCRLRCALHDRTTTARHKCIDMSSIPVRAVATAVTPLFEAALLPPDHKRQHERPKIKEDLRQAEDESDIP